MIGLGPFSAKTAALAAAAILAWLVARYLLRKTDAPSRRVAASVLLDALFVGLFAARAAYVIRWWPEYAARPWSFVAIGDGGFNVWAGTVAALAWGLWRTRRHRTQRRPMLAGMAAGLALWGVMLTGLSVALRDAPPLPSLTLSSLDGRAIALDSHRGQPIVMNLWATWCPPCRREMPVLAQAQTDYPDVRFLMINQGESAQTVAEFVQSQGLTFDHLLLDPQSEAMRAAGARALPTTLYFDTNGRLVEAHLGELTAARLRDTLHRHLRQTPAALASGK
ncbi:TlpA disulfide reductase family protein [Pandoraea oxalativorans]|uniref:Redoxin n=1 Tax=Pandoraea oxalativorans TaxID=573737 RepID=A0A0E3Y9V0_9BURK|nr:TlpA disulfide reductase family protein [Pandoraea oxalativorans]AKC68466.1 redoxin [Pandoraea oxalativorans]